METLPLEPSALRALPLEALTGEWLTALEAWATGALHALHHLLCEGGKFVAAELFVTIFIEPHQTVDERFRGSLATEGTAWLRTAETARARLTAAVLATAKPRSSTESLSSAESRSFTEALSTEGTAVWLVAAAWALTSWLITARTVATWSVTITRSWLSLIPAISSRIGTLSAWAKGTGLVAVSAWERTSLERATGKALAWPCTWPSETGAEGAGHFRPQFFAADRAVAVFVEAEQGNCGVGNLIRAEAPVTVGIEGLANRVHGRTKGSAHATFTWHSVSWLPITWGTFARSAVTRFSFARTTITAVAASFPITRPSISRTAFFWPSVTTRLLSRAVFVPWRVAFGLRLTGLFTSRFCRGLCKSQAGRSGQ